MPRNVDEVMAEQMGEEAPLDESGEALANVERRQNVLPPAAQDQRVQAGGAPSPISQAPPPPPPLEPPPQGGGSGGDFSYDPRVYQTRSGGGGEFPQMGPSYATQPGEPPHWKGLPEYEKNYLRAHPEVDYQRNRLAIEAETGRALSRAIEAGPAAAAQAMQRGGVPHAFITQADPETQQHVKETESAIDQVNQGNFTPEQKQYQLDQLNGRLQQWDPQHVYRKGGALSQQTEADKRWAQKVHRDPHTGLTVAWDDKGTPHVLQKGLDPGEMMMKKQERIHAQQMHDSTLQLNQQKFQHAQAEAVRKAQDHARETDERARQHAEKMLADHKEKLGKFFDKTFKLGETKTVPGRMFGTKEVPVTEEDRQEHLKKREEYIEKKMLEDTEAESDQAYSHWGQGVKNQLAYQKAYTELHQDKAPAHTLAEMRKRHEQAVEKMRLELERASRARVVLPPAVPPPASVSEMMQKAYSRRQGIQ